MKSYLLTLVLCSVLFGQSDYKWLHTGSLHNWYSRMGCEREEGRLPNSPVQDGLQWPAIYPHRDSQVSKGLWIGARNFTNETGKTYPYKVVHVGPRSNGIGEFFPVHFKMYGKFVPTQVYVNGNISVVKKYVEIDELRPNIRADRMIYNEVNCQLGITMKRKIMQFSKFDHDNYHLMEYTFINTGNVDDDPEIELPDNTITDMYIYMLYRYAMARECRYVIGNASGWGINTINDARRDGPVNPVTYNDPPTENYRTQFSWHGYWSNRPSQYCDNIGGPVWNADDYSVRYGYLTTADTVGRLAGANIVGVATIYADDPENPGTDSPNQPSTTNSIPSDAARTMANDPENESWMQEEYQLMSQGWQPRHSWTAVPDGNFAYQTTDILSPGGYSFANGYGPYTIAPGDSICLVLIEAAAGLSNEMCIEIGKQYKRGEIDNVAKNVWVLSGRDSLFKTFQTGLENFQSGYTAGEGVAPPQTFNIDENGSGTISLSWIMEPSPGVTGFRIYRARDSWKDHFADDTLIYTAGANERNYDDLTTKIGFKYYYHIIAVYSDGQISSRYYTQSYDPAIPRPVSVEDKSEISKYDLVRNYPNPFNPQTTFEIELSRGSLVNLSIYDLSGKLIKVLVNKNLESGKHRVTWNAENYSSGIYIYRLTAEHNTISKKCILLR